MDTIIQAFEHKGKRVINSKLIYTKLQISTPYNKWISRKINKYQFKLHEDYFEIIEESSGGRRPKNHYITVENYQLLLSNGSAGTNHSELIDYLTDQTEKIVVVKELKRKEFDFGEQLKGLLQGLHIVQSQYKVLNYRIDFYIPSLNLAIEYDELHHETPRNKSEDIFRQVQIEKLINCHFIRVKENSELQGLNEIIKYMHVIFSTERM